VERPGVKGHRLRGGLPGPAGVRLLGIAVTPATRIRPVVRLRPEHEPSADTSAHCPRKPLLNSMIRAQAGRRASISTPSRRDMELTELRCVPGAETGRSCG
jgi:hypothetical protein